MDEHGQAPRWMCTRCGEKEIAPFEEYCDECQKIRPPAISGFLWVPLIFLFIGILSLARDTINIGTDWLDLYNDLTSQGNVTFSVLFITTLLALSGTAVTAGLFLKRSRWLPECYIALRVTVLLILIIQVYLLADMVDDDTLRSLTIAITGSAVFAVIWIVYFLVSAQVKQTFTG